jgi:hypothetical protein
VLPPLSVGLLLVFFVTGVEDEGRERLPGVVVELDSLVLRRGVLTMCVRTGRRSITGVS